MAMSDPLPCATDVARCLSSYVTFVTLPSASVATSVNACVPTPSPLKVSGLAQLASAPPSSEQLTLAAGSSTRTPMLAERPRSPVAGTEVKEATGPVVSIRNGPRSSSPTLP